MKFRPQFSAAWIAALLTAGGWFLFWLTAFSPEPKQPVPQPHSTALHLIPASRQPDHLLQPTLFARPSEQGFSGVFPDESIHLRLELERPGNPAVFLARAPQPPEPIVQSALMNPARLPQNALSVPGAPPRAIRPALQQHRIFLSSELPALADSGRLPDLNAENLPAALSMVLFLRADGTVERALLETPVDRPAPLLQVLRTLRFHPPQRPVQGRAELRLAPGGGLS